MNRLHTPFFNLPVNFLIEIAGGAGAYFRVPQRLGDIFHSTNRNSGQIHFDQCLFNTALLRLIPFDDLRFKRKRPKTRYFEFNFARCCQKLPLICSCPGILSIRTSLIPAGVADCIRFFIQKSIQGIFNGLSDQAIQMLHNLFFIDFDGS